MVLFGKLLIWLVGTGFLVLLQRNTAVFALSDRNFSLLAHALLVGSRVSLFLLLFLILRIPAQSDVSGIYYPLGKYSAAGLMPYRDFETSYAPLFPWLCSIALRFWDSPLALIVLSMLFEVGAFCAWIPVVGNMLGQAQMRTAAIMYLASPVPLVNVVIGGQNQVWVSLFLALSFYALWLKRETWSGLALGLSIIFVKILPLIFLPAVLVSASKRRRWFLGFLALPIIVYGYLLVRGINIVAPLLHENLDRTSGTLPFVLTLFGDYLTTPVGRFLVIVFGGGAILVVFFTVCFKVQIGRFNVIHFVTLLALTFMLVSKKAYPGYLVMFFFPLCATAARYARRWWSVMLFALFGLVAVLEPSLWFRLLGAHALHEVVIAVINHQTTPAYLGAFLAVEVVLLGCYVVYDLLAWRALRNPKSQS
jgi:hypothetical protein